MTVRVTIDGRQIEGPAGQTIIEAAAAAGIEIPALCHHPRLTPVGSCRLCLVEIDGWGEPAAACVTAIQPAMRVRTETDSLTESRRATLELLLADYHDAGYATAGAGPTEFDRWVSHYGARAPLTAQPRHPIDSDSNPFVWVDLNKCILCTRCVRACDEVQGRMVWGVGQRGRETRIIAGADTELLDARCESCGACVAWCPTGALDDRPSMGCPSAERMVRTTCGYCGVGCQFDFQVANDQVVRVVSTPEAPVNGMALCVKGRYGFGFIHHAERLTRPMVRAELLEAPSSRRAGQERGPWQEVSWDRALDLVADRLTSLRAESGPDAIGLLSSAKCSNEENYLMQKLARQVIGTNNVDHCARLCHSSTVAGLAMCYGSGAMSNSMDDVAEHSEALLVIGSNTTEQHPVFGSMLRQAVLRRGVKLVLADPRRIDLAEFATLHLRQRPGTDVALLNGLMHIILERGWHDREFIERRCEQFEEFADTLAAYPPRRVAEITGVPEEDLHSAAEVLAVNKPMAVIWAMGITQHTTGVINVLSLGNLQMLLGNMGLPGGGVNPLRGQNNVQGACDMGALPNVFSGYQAVADEAVRRKFADAWALGPAASDSDSAATSTESWAPSASSGLTVTEMVDAAGAGRLRGLYIMGENPVLTDPDSNHVRQCLASAEFVVLQEILPSATSEYADVLLPGTTFAERSGTFTNTERRVQLFRQAISPRGEARPDWQIVRDLARRLLDRGRRRPAGPQADWSYSSAAEVMEEIAEVTPSYAGVRHARLEAGERLQWPVAGPDHGGTPILHRDHFTRGLGRFHAVDHLPPQELPCEQYPLLLTTGRVIYHWHGGEMTRRSAPLEQVCPASYAEVSPDDAARLGLAEGQEILIHSRRGRMRALAAITDRVPPGVVFGNFHFPSEWNVNNLTLGALDPTAKIPEYKVCAVSVEAAS